LCYVALDYDQETQLGAALRKNYETNDGQLLDFDIERFQCPEALFNPTLVGCDTATPRTDFLPISDPNHV
jgi:actin-related protein